MDTVDDDYFAKQAADAEALPPQADDDPDNDDAHADDIPAGLIELSIALDTGDAESTAKAAAELAELGGES